MDQYRFADTDPLASADAVHWLKVVRHILNLAEICNLRWDWEICVPVLDTIVFIAPGTFVLKQPTQCLKETVIGLS